MSKWYNLKFGKYSYTRDSHRICANEKVYFKYFEIRKLKGIIIRAVGEKLDSKPKWVCRYNQTEEAFLG